MTAYDNLALFLILVFGTVIIVAILILRDSRKKPHLVECSRCKRVVYNYLAKQVNVRFYNRGHDKYIVRRIDYRCMSCTSDNTEHYDVRDIDSDKPVEEQE